MTRRDHLAIVREPGQDAIELLLASWERSLLAQHHSPRTLQSYIYTVRTFDRWLYDRGHAGTAAAVSRADVEVFISDAFTRHRPSTVRHWVVVLKVFFRWLVEEGELAASPLARIKTPAVTKQPTPVLTDDAIKRLLKSCEGNDFASRRDLALFRLLLSTGMRRRELARLTVADVDLREQAVQSVIKGGRAHVFAIGRKCTLALDRYLRARMRHPHGQLDALWLSHIGALSYGGVADILDRHTKAAGLPHLWPHLFRHTFAHQWLSDGGSEQGLMHSVGWKSRAMLDHYGRSVAEQRARDEYHRIEPGDQY